MTIRVAINGFGRIGRLVLRALYESQRQDITIVAINDLFPVETNAHLLQYDSVHGKFGHQVSYQDNHLMIDQDTISFSAERDPAKCNWKKQEIDIVFECSGVFNKRADVIKHIEAGAKKVLISAPSSDADIMIVYGVNHQNIQNDHIIVSNASCTTNCLSPIASVLNKAVGIEHGFMTTIHSYTGDQKLVDSGHQDLHRARSGALSMIPTSTGAARAVSKVLPELSGKLDGTSIRVPTPNVSVVDFKFTAEKSTSVEEINQAIIQAADGPMKNVLGYYDVPLVSCDFIHNPLSSIFALKETNVIHNKFVRVLSWYDNEWGFSNRMLDTAIAMMKAA